MASHRNTTVTVGRNRASGDRLLRFAHLAVALFLFFLGLQLMGSAFGLLGTGVASTLIETTSNPFVGLFVGILATSIIQSSSTITSLVVSIVAAGGLTVGGAIPIIMGANVGTSITSTIVSLGHVTRKDEFRLATAGATVHDIFNLLTVSILLPMEMMFGIVSHPARWLASGLSGVGGAKLLSPVHMLVGPVSRNVVEFLGANGSVVLIAGLLVLFGAIRYMVTVLRSLALGASEKAIHTSLFADGPRVLLAGLLITATVQSSSITTSVIVPLVAAGIVSVSQIFPFVVGANIGTTVTALLAALALAGNGDAAGMAALQAAFAHFCFNVFGAALFVPLKSLRRIPIRLATALGDLVARNRGYAVAYLCIVFLVIPILVIAATQ